MEVTHGLVIADELQDFGGIELLRIFLLQKGGNFQAHAHGAHRRAVRDLDADAAATLPGVEAADGNEGLVGKAQAGKILGVQFRGDVLAIHPGRAELLERRFGPAAHGNPSALENFQAGIENGAFQRAEIGGGRNPAAARAFKKIVAVPVFHLDDAEIGIDVIFGVVELREFADGERITHGDGIVGDETGFVRIEHGPFEDVATQGIGAVEHKEGNAVFRGFLHAVGHRGGVGIEANTGILDVENERINIFQHVVGGTQLVAIEAVDGEPGRRIFGGRDLVNVVAGDAVLGTEQRDQLNSGRLREELHGGAPLKIHAGVIGDETDMFAAQ